MELLIKGANIIPADITTSLTKHFDECESINGISFTQKASLSQNNDLLIPFCISRHTFVTQALITLRL